MKALADLRPLREHPAFRRLWLGTTASAFGASVGTFGVTFFVWSHTHSPAALGLVGLCTATPLIAFALLGSAFADHVDRRRLALLVTVGQVVTTLAMAGVAAAGPVWAMFVLAAAGAGLAALGQPARRAIVARLLPRDRLGAGLALNQLSFQLAMLLGPAVAGLITAQWGTAVCLLVDAVTFAAALAGVASLPPGEAAGAEATAARAGAGAVWAGIRFVARTPAVRGALLADLSATVLAMPMALFPVLNQEKFGGSPRVLGLFTTAVAVGGVLASALSGLITHRPRPGLALLGCGLVWGAALAGVGLAGRLAVVLGLLAVAGAADTWAVVLRGTLTQSNTPEGYRGRAAALEHIVGVAGPQLGGVRAGLLATATSGRAAMILGGLSCLVGTGLVAAANPGLRRFSVAEAGSQEGAQERAAAPQPA